MDSPADSLQLKLAWQNVFSLRACPPESVLFSEGDNARLKRHLESCPFCRERLAMRPERGAWETLGTNLDRTEEPPDRERAAVGEIREVARSLGGWNEEGHYCNAPLVLVLETHESGEAWARVAQLCGENRLAGPNDLPLEPDQGFIECWNTYALALADLGRRRGRVDAKTLSSARSGADEPPLPVPEHSVLYFFRQLELEVAAYMTTRSMKRLLPKPEGGSATGPVFTPSGADLRTFLKRAYPDADIPERAADDYELLAFTRFPQTELPLAAAQGADRLSANFVRLTSDGFELLAVPYELTLVEWIPGGVLVTGKLRKTGLNPQVIHGWWKRRRGEPLAADEQGLHPDGTHFRLIFKGLQREEAEAGEPVILVLGDAL